MNNLKKYIYLKLVNKSTSTKGFILMTAYMVIAMMSIFSIGIMSRNNMFLQATERNQNKIIAFNAAEAALDLAISELSADSTYGGPGSFANWDNYNVQGGYAVSVCPPSCPNGYVQPVNANTRLIIATGHAPDNVTTSTAYETRTIETYVSIGTSSLFNFAVFADQDMQLVGNANVDSYNSNNGAYDPNTAGSNGDISTNGTGNSDVSLNGNVTVNGDAQVGPGSDPNNVINISGNAVISGSQSAASALQNFSSPTVPGTATSIGQLKVQGNSTYNLPAGTYFASSIDIKGNGSVNASGTVEIYVSGSVSIAGNGVSTSANLPPNFIIYVTGNEDVKVTGNGDFYGAIYAPESDVQISGNGSVYGAVVSDTFQLNGNGDVHYDEALNDVGGGGSPDINVLSWQELYTSAGS